MLIEIDIVRHGNLLKIIILLYAINFTNGIRMLTFIKFYDEEWIGSNFPIVADRFLPLSEQCVNDTVSQLAALRNRLPWAIESKLRFETRTNLEFSILIFKTNKSSVRIFWLTDGQNC